jgi:hypothetical protein
MAHAGYEHRTPRSRQRRVYTDFTRDRCALLISTHHVLRVGRGTTGSDIMRTLTTMAFVFAMFLIWPAAPAESAQSGVSSRPYTLGPPGCVRVWSRRSRETRYAGAPRCRRTYV